MKKGVYYCLSCLALVVLLSSCASKKKMVYFQGSMNGSENTNYNPILHTDDFLTVIVMGMDQETVKPFNLPVTTTMMNAGGYSLGSQTPPGYLVDINGNIDFPLIGKVKVAGLTRSVVIDSLKARLKPYLTNPTILIRILNFKVTVLGEVNNPGTFTIPNERVTLPEVLGIAGDLKITAKRKNIIVIRDVDGKKTEYKVDLTSKDIFSSPVYYLNQNDVVYVEPNRAKLNSAVLNQSNVGIIISAVSLIITVIVLIKK
jgi:polysaccharide export outer membrane protein